jgi:hypothetical protein
MIPAWWILLGGLSGQMRWWGWSRGDSLGWHRAVQWVLPAGIAGWVGTAIAGTLADRTGATEHGPKGRAQCRGMAGQVSELRGSRPSAAPPEAVS